MSDGFNTVTLLGNIGKDPELKMTAGGPLLKIRLATPYRWKDKETQKTKEKTEWHTVTLWGTRAQGIAPFLKKGQQILVQGRLETSSYEKDGQKHYRTEVIAGDIRFGSSPNPNGALHRPTAPPLSVADAAPF